MADTRNGPRMADVARAAGVSTMTVSRAFRQDGSINKETREQILKTAEAMGYVFDMNASEFRSQRSGFVAVTVPSINNPNFADTVQGLTEGLLGSGLQVLLGYTNYNIQEEEKLLTQLMRRKPEAVLVTGGSHTDGAQKLLKHAGIPVIETWDIPNNPIGHSVGFSNAETGVMMANHLVEQGYRRIAFMGGANSSDTRGQDRANGFARRLQELGLDADRIISVGPPPVSAAQGAEAAQILRQKFPDTDAVMCVSDTAAFGLMTELQRMGHTVPDEVAVAGFGAFDQSAFSLPPITTIDPDGKAIGREAATLLIKLRQSQSRQRDNTAVKTKPTLLERSSTLRVIR